MYADPGRSLSHLASTAIPHRPLTMSNDPTAHVMDYPALDLGHSTGSCRTLSLVDLDVHIWGLEECAGSSLPIGVVVSWKSRVGVTAAALMRDVPNCSCFEYKLLAGLNLRPRPRSV